MFTKGLFVTRYGGKDTQDVCSDVDDLRTAMRFLSDAGEMGVQRRDLLTMLTEIGEHFQLFECVPELASAPSPYRFFIVSGNCLMLIPTETALFEFIAEVTLECKDNGSTARPPFCTLGKG